MSQKAVAHRQMPTPPARADQSGVRRAGLRTAVFFEEAPIEYRLPGHSAPPTALRKDFAKRQEERQGAAKL